MGIIPNVNNYINSEFWNYITINLLIINWSHSRAMAQVVSHRLLTAEGLVGPCRICGGQSGTVTRFSPSSSVFLRSISFHSGFPCSHIIWRMSKGLLIAAVQTPGHSPSTWTITATEVISNKSGYIIFRQDLFPSFVLERTLPAGVFRLTVGFFGRVISPSQRPLPTQDSATQNKDPTLNGIRTQSISVHATKAYLGLRPCGPNLCVNKANARTIETVVPTLFSVSPG
jgi:hypothetical protein